MMRFTVTLNSGQCYLSIQSGQVAIMKLSFYLKWYMAIKQIWKTTLFGIIGNCFTKNQKSLKQVSAEVVLPKQVLAVKTKTI